MAGNQPFPVHRNHHVEPVLDVRKVGVGHAAIGNRLQRNPIDREYDFLLGVPHHQRAVGVVLADIEQFERCSAKCD